MGATGRGPLGFRTPRCLVAWDPEQEPGVQGVLWGGFPRRLVVGDPEVQPENPRSLGGPGALLLPDQEPRT